MLARRHLLAALALSPLIYACSKDDDEKKGGSAADESGPITLQGAGATFPYPIYSKWMDVYHQHNPKVRINYQSIGSGGGIRQIIARTVDFGATDAPMKEEEAKKAEGNLVHIPTTLGAVVVAYNVPEVKQPLKLSADVLSGIFLGEIKKWNDPKIAEANPGANLPNKPVSVVYRSDGSGTTSVFTDYLAAVNEQWKKQVGVGKSVRWPTGLGAKGNEGVTGQVKTTPYSIGYLELAYATQNKLPVAEIQNQAGKFVKPTTEAITAAAKGVDLPDSLHASIVNAKGAEAYPIASYTYILVYEDMKDPREAKALAEFLWWAVHDGQKYAANLDYAQLPTSVVAKVEGRLKSLKAQGKLILSAN